jgi:peptide/nickel transport system substrate-binding protein
MLHLNRRTLLHQKAWRAAAALVPLLFLTACGGSSPSSSEGSSTNPAPTDGLLTVGLLGDIGQPPDPDIYYANNGLAIVLNAYEGLVQYKPNVDAVEIAPRLATEWSVNKTNTVYTFKLRDKVTFHDGTPFTSAAVKVAFDRRIKVKGGAAYMVQGVKSVATPDDLTAVVTLSKPNSAFLDYLASPFGPKMESPTGLKQNAGSDDAQTYLSTKDLGTGPYSLE